MVRRFLLYRFHFCPTYIISSVQSKYICLMTEIQILSFVMIKTSPPNNMERCDFLCFRGWRMGKKCNLKAKLDHEQTSETINSNKKNLTMKNHVQMGRVPTITEHKTRKTFSLSLSLSFSLSLSLSLSSLSLSLSLSQINK